MHRRDFLKLPPALALGGIGITLVPAAGRAQDDAPQLYTALQRFTVGEMTVTALSDGFLPFDVSAAQGISPEEFDAMLRDAFLDPGQFRASVNAFLAEHGDERILIDAGTGTIFGPTLGQLQGNLAAAGLAPEDITAIFATHLHPDHVGGTIADGSAVFPNARLAVSAADVAFWGSAERKGEAPEMFHPFFDIAQAVLSAYEGRVEAFEGEAQLAPGITALPMPGHTPGHSGMLLESDGETLLIWADIVHMPPIQFARPDVTIAFDIDPALAASTRAAVMDRVATDRLMVAGSHLTFPGFGHVARAGDAYRFEPAPWQFM